MTMYTKGEEIAAKMRCRLDGVDEKYWESRIALVREHPWLAEQIDDAIGEAFQRGVQEGRASGH